MNKRSFLSGLLVGIALSVIAMFSFSTIKGWIQKMPDQLLVIGNSQELPTQTSRPPIPTMQSLESLLAESWYIFPIDIQISPIGDGWQTVTIELAIENNSDTWGRLYIIRDSLSRIKIRTAEGYTYNSNGSYVGFNNYLAPGFKTRDSFLFFTVAENTSGYVVTIPQFTVDFYSPQYGEIRTLTIKQPIRLNIDTDIKKVDFPTDLPINEFNDFSSPIEVRNKGTVTLDGIYVEKGGERNRIDLKMTYQNADDGYTQEIKPMITLIGREGILYSPVGSEVVLKAGPGQSVNDRAVFSILSTDERLVAIFIVRSMIEVFNLSMYVP